MTAAGDIWLYREQDGKTTYFNRPMPPGFPPLSIIQRGDGRTMKAGDDPADARCVRLDAKGVSVQSARYVLIDGTVMSGPQFSDFRIVAVPQGEDRAVVLEIPSLFVEGRPLEERPDLVRLLGWDLETDQALSPAAHLALLAGQALAHAERQASWEERVATARACPDCETPFPGVIVRGLACTHA